MKKRFLGILLVLILLLTLLPTAALAVEQFINLTPGGTYYFDLSGADIPGTANAALPDGTLHYVPFTYAGTVNAYSLTEAGVSTDDNVTLRNHSLFIADYNVTHTVSWDTLNSADLIFGKAYESSGVGYTLRAPSVGSQAYQPNNSQTALHCTPQSNEWDVLAGAGKIKNWENYFSLGQDAYSGFEGYHMLRGNLSVKHARMLEPGETGVRQDRCYRPVLEAPSALASDALKPVTLDLSGGSVNGETSISIVVKNGESFTAPSAEGLSRPAGNTGTYFAWTGDDGETYDPHAAVPAGVTTLTAQWVDGVIVGDFVITGDVEGTDYSFDSGVLTVSGESPLMVSMKPDVVATTNRIVVGEAVCANITLAGVNIETVTGAPLDLSNAGASTLTLAAGTKNVLKTNDNKPGIYTGAGKLTINGSGRLDVYGGLCSAGIGGDRGDTTGGTLVIDGGIINAYGGAAVNSGDSENSFGYHSGAGIGGSSGSVAGNITINGGTINAVGGSAADGLEKGGGAGIGGGGSRVYSEIGGVITICGGTVTAQGGTGPFGAGAGIGGGGSSSSIKSVTITGGVINAYGGANGAAGIGGGGHQGWMEALSITGGFITATGTHKLDGSGSANAIGGATGEAPSDLSGVTGAVIIDGAANTGSVYGSATLTGAAEIPAGVTLTVPAGATLTVGAGGALTNNGEIKATGTLTKNGGTITGSGEIQYPAAWQLTNVTHNKGEEITYASTIDGYTATLTAAQGYALPESVTVKVGGAVLTGGYSYNSASGALTIDKASVTGSIEITAAGRQPSTGGGSSTPTTPTTTLPASGDVPVSATVTGGTAKVDVPQGKLETALNGGEKEITVDLSGKSGVTNIELSGKTLDTIGAAGASVTIKTESGAVTLDAVTLKGLAAAGEAVKLSIEPTSIKMLTRTEQGMVGSRPVLSLSVAVGAKQVTNFDGSVTVSVPYEKPESERTEGLCVWFLDGGKLIKMTATYDPATDTIAFTTPHFSTYVIGYFPFTDVADSAWYYGDAAYAYINALFSGTSETEFSPSAPMTRAMLWTVLARLAGVDTAQNTNVNYYDAAQKWAVENGLTDGTNPNSAITREQMVTTLYRYAGLQGLDVSVGEDTNILSYDDASDVAEYAVPAMQWACGAQVVQGANGTLNPRGGATRAQVAAMLHRFATSLV